ncbi:hypothetical protein DNH61_03820 [Paenibacillus sambharensis]|uniref:Knr4/Smi1-like domain-containing protein n=1 Tax=Paenibacillus sambharensis TaxID=1803190 RepID=A0A2W1LQI7_9BACL|nr:SMI1/KNR4 family protein [Paenibacillus sambharensis]PZD97212.1 hypothetical protein DNH61_03820 [Paenibacillus sambharensis]
MGMSIKWEYGQYISMAQVKTIEEKVNVKFPKSYLDIVLNFDKSRPEILNAQGEWVDGVVKTDTVGPISFELLSFRDVGHRGEIPMLFAYEVSRSWFPNPEGIIPFAITGAGDHLLFDYRVNQVDPSVGFFYHESDDDNVELIANNFKSFLGLIYPDDM